MQVSGLKSLLFLRISVNEVLLAEAGHIVNMKDIGVGVGRRKLGEDREEL